MVIKEARNSNDISRNVEIDVEEEDVDGIMEGLDALEEN